MSIVSVESGNGTGYSAQVNSAGKLLVDVTEIQRIVEPVTTRPQIMPVETTTPTAQNGSSTEVVSALTGRRWLEIQNLGDFPVHILLKNSTFTATAFHRRLDPGEVFSWRDGVAYEGAVQAIAVGGNSPLAVMQFFTV